MNRMIAVLMLTGLLGFGCAGSSSSSESVELPAFPTAARFRKLDGKYVNLSAFRGDAALVTVIQTWSDYALREVPMFNQLAERYGDRLTILCVALDERPDMVQIFIDTFKPAYEVLLVDNLQRFTGPGGPFGPITRIPTSVLLDQEGRVVARMDGTWRPEVLRRAIEQLVGPPSQ